MSLSKLKKNIGDAKDLSEYIKPSDILICGEAAQRASDGDKRWVGRFVQDYVIHTNGSVHKFRRPTKRQLKVIYAIRTRNGTSQVFLPRGLTVRFVDAKTIYHPEFNKFIDGLLAKGYTPKMWECK